MVATSGIASKLPRELATGLVLPGLDAYQELVHKLYGQDWLSQIELSYSRPLYRGTPTIDKALQQAHGSLEKFDVYVEHGLRDRETRVQLAKTFQEDYLRRYPRSEMRDVFFASGQVLQVRFALQQPCSFPYVDELMFDIHEHPHDVGIVRQIQNGRGIDVAHVTGELRMFLHNIANPRHRKRPAVQAVMNGPRSEPMIVELITSGAILGYFLRYLRPLVEEVQGAIARLDEVVR